MSTHRMEGYDNKARDAETGTGFKIQEESRPKSKYCRITGPCLIAIIIILLFVVVIMMTGLLTKGFGAWDGSGVCETQACAQASARITYNMDETANPCDDFYKYACGGFAKKTVLAASAVQMGSTNLATQQLTVHMKALLELPSSIDNLNVVKQAKILYGSCMNETAIDALGSKPLLDIIAKSGGWALITPGWNEANFNFVDYMIDVSEVVQPLIQYGVQQNPFKASEQLLAVHQSKTTLPAYLYANTPAVNAYTEALREFAKVLGGDANTIDTELPKMIAFEAELAKITQVDAGAIPSPNDIMTLDQTVNEFPGLDLKAIITGGFARANVQISGSNKIFIKHKEYVKNLATLIAKTDKRTLATYILYASFQEHYIYLDSKTRASWENLNAVLTGTRATPSRYETCANVVNTVLPLTLTRMFVDENFKEGTTDINILASILKQTFVERLADQDWLDEKSRQGAEIKANAMNFIMGYPDHILKNEELEKETKITDMTDGAFYDNFRRRYAEMSIESMRKLYKEASKTEWAFPSPLQVNAFYAVTYNNVIIPVGILNPSFYDPLGLKSLNYGVVGNLMGHEITHGYDSQGRFYDKEGSINEWMTQTAIDNFNSKAKCFEDQFSQIVIEQLGAKVNGKLTLGENIADAGAIKQAFQAYQKWVQKNGPEKRLPGLTLTNDQLFFVGFGQFYCSITTTQFLMQLSQVDNHTPFKERVYGVLMNSDDFAKSFNCPLGSRMNPTKKCSVW